MNKEQALQKVLKNIPKTFGKSFEELKKDILKSCKANGYGCSDYFKDHENGYWLFYTENPNFQNQNGKGAGFYARLHFCGFVSDLKLN